MSEKKTPMTGLLEERTERRAGYDEDAPENPYWLDEEPEPHPNPELGCIRRNLCCRNSPGWFGPGEVEAAADFLKMSADDFVRKYIVICSVDVDGEPVEVFAPVKLGRDGKPLIPPATRADRLYQMLRSPCVFFDGNGCKIYGARPVECRDYICTKAPEDNLSHVDIGRLWLAGRDEGEA
jgi:Fe-S-cluster containining protein